MGKNRTNRHVKATTWDSKEEEYIHITLYICIKLSTHTYVYMDYELKTASGMETDSDLTALPTTL